MTANETSDLPPGGNDGIDYLPTSVLLDRLIAAAPAERASVNWIVDRLDERSFGLMMLVLGVFALIPGVATVPGLLLLFPAAQLILGREQPVLPRFVGNWEIRTERLAGTLNRIRPSLRRLERLVHPRWLRFTKSRRIVGIVVTLLALSILSPVPLLHVVPAAAVILISFAFLEEDGLLLMLGMAVAAVSFAITGMAIWGAIAATEAIESAL
ncbi:MAG: exopolysaccharide biosynthesis protein [Dongiaceae bacterium]